MHAAIHAFLAEPAVADPPRRVWRDWVLVGVMVVGGVLEAILRTDVVLPGLALLMCLAIAPTILWRRQYPLAMTAVAFGIVGVASLSAAPFTDGPLGLNSTAVVLVLPYGVFRWASGRHAAIAALIMVVAWVIGISTDPGTVGDAIGGFMVLLVAALLGAMFRYRDTARVRAVEEVKLRERELLARELHDTVAHHVSAIAIQAQAGRALAATRPQEALDVLAVIEDAASRTLSEMRAMVGALRRGDESELSPQQGVADLHRLQSVGSESLRVEIDMVGDLDELGPAIDAAIYRIAQESVTNAFRHARRASVVEVRVVGDVDRVRLTVDDDGESVGAGAATTTGYGLLGMTERATLLGGAVTAGPGPHGGWRVAAVLPRARTTS